MREFADSTERLGIPFRPEYKTGVLEIDEQHLDLFNNYRDVAALLDYGHDMLRITRRLDEMIDNVRQHFADEEAVMGEMGYPMLSDHQSIHRRLMQNIEDFRSCLPAALSRADAAAVAAYLKFWLVEHIHVDDRTFGGFISAGAAG
jgi:hemerythrin-like metal-binding protein